MTSPIDNIKRHLRISPKVANPDPEPLGEPWAGETLEMPDSLHGDIFRAARLVDDLAADGVQLRYELDEQTGRVTATLCTLEGERLRTVPLVDALGSSFSAA